MLFCTTVHDGTRQRCESRVLEQGRWLREERTAEHLQGAPPSSIESERERDIGTVSRLFRAAGQLRQELRMTLPRRATNPAARRRHRHLKRARADAQRMDGVPVVDCGVRFLLVSRRCGIRGWCEQREEGGRLSPREFVLKIVCVC